MNPRRILLTLLMMTCAMSVIVSQTITITVVQNKNAPETAITMSRIIEDALLGIYYDQGMIVTTTDIAYDGNNYKNKNYGVKNAAHGMSDYVLVVNMVYGQTEKNNEDRTIKYAELKKASWKMVRVKDIYNLAEQDLDLAAVPIKEFDPHKQIQMLGELIARNSLSALRNAGKGEVNR